MVSTFSPNLRTELIGTGEQSGTWGTTTNGNLGTLLEQAITGVQDITHDNTAAYTLTTNDGAVDEARNAVINIIGTLTADRQVIVPSVDKVYIAQNSTGGGFAITVKTSLGTGVEILNGKTALVYCDATDVKTVVNPNTIVVDIDDTDSPFAVPITSSGTLFNINATDGPVVINLPSLGSVNNEFIASFRRSDAILANAITINADGSDNIPGLVSGELDSDDQTITLHAGNGTDWLPQSYFLNLDNSGYRTESTNTAVAATENNFLIDCTLSLTLSIPAATSLGNKFVFYVKANGGDVTIDPNGAETIDGVATIIIRDGSTARIICDGANFHTGIFAKGTVEKIASGVESNVSSLEFLNLSPDFSEYLFLFWELDPIVNAVQFRLRTSINANGVPYTASGYNYSNIFTRANDSNTVKASNLNSATQLVIAGSDSGLSNIGKTSGYIRLIAPAIDQDGFTSIEYKTGGGNTTGNQMMEFGTGTSREFAPILAFELFMTSGDIDSMQWAFYGTRI